MIVMSLEDNDTKLKVSFEEVHEDDSEHEYVLEINLNNYEIFDK